MKTKTINQIVTFKASPNEVYSMLMDSEKHSEFTQSECRIGRSVGDKFTAYDGYIEGKNLQLVPGRKIMQEWRSSDWPEGHYSKVTFEFTAKGKGAEVRFTHEGVPEDDYKEKSEGWKEHYWEKMRNYLVK